MPANTALFQQTINKLLNMNPSTDDLREKLMTSVDALGKLKNNQAQIFDNLNQEITDANNKSQNNNDAYIESIDQAINHFRQEHHLPEIELLYQSIQPQGVLIDSIFSNLDEKSEPTDQLPNQEIFNQVRLRILTENPHNNLENYQKALIHTLNFLKNNKSPIFDDYNQDLANALTEKDYKQFIEAQYKALMKLTDMSDDISEQLDEVFNRASIKFDDIEIPTSADSSKVEWEEVMLPEAPRPPNLIADDWIIQYNNTFNAVPIDVSQQEEQERLEEETKHLNIIEVAEEVDMIDDFLEDLKEINQSDAVKNYISTLQEKLETVTTVARLRIFCETNLFEFFDFVIDSINVRMNELSRRGDFEAADKFLAIEETILDIESELELQYQIQHEEISLFNSVNDILCEIAIRKLKEINPNKENTQINELETTLSKLKNDKSPIYEDFNLQLRAAVRQEKNEEFVAQVESATQKLITTYNLSLNKLQEKPDKVAEGKWDVVELPGMPERKSSAVSPPQKNASNNNQSNDLDLEVFEEIDMIDGFLDDLKRINQSEPIKFYISKLQESLNRIQTVPDLRWFCEVKLFEFFDFAIDSLNKRMDDLSKRGESEEAARLKTYEDTILDIEDELEKQYNIQYRLTAILDDINNVLCEIAIQKLNEIDPNKTNPKITILIKSLEILKNDKNPIFDDFNMQLRTATREEKNEDFVSQLQSAIQNLIATHKLSSLRDVQSASEVKHSGMFQISTLKNPQSVIETPSPTLRSDSPPPTPGGRKSE